MIWYSPALFGEIWLRYRVGPPPIPNWTLMFAPLRELISLTYLLINYSPHHQSESVVKLVVLLWIAFYAVGMTGAVFGITCHATRSCACGRLADENAFIAVTLIFGTKTEHCNKSEQ